MNSPIFQEYCSYLKQYKDKYGEKTMVLMQVGSFYEVYAVLKDEIQLGETDIYHLCHTIMNIAVSTKNEGKTSEHLMGGFQMPYSGKFIKLLIHHGYTVVLVEQVSEAPKPVRDVVKIISPGTYLETYNQDDNNYMMSIYIETIDRWNAVGISVIDVSTGENYIYQVGHSPDTHFWKDEIHRLLSYYSPKEVLVQLHNVHLTQEEMVNYWDIDDVCLQINHYQDSCFETISYQCEVLQKVFPDVKPFEELQMVHTPELCKSYVYMLQYIYDHKIDCLRNISKPIPIDQVKHLSLTSNSARQLNVVSNYSYYKGKCESLYSLCNRCGFAGGRRMLKHRLLYPSVDGDELNLRYSRIGYFQTEDRYKFTKQTFRKLIDLDKTLRKLGLGTMTTDDLNNTKLSYDFVNRWLQSDVITSELWDIYPDIKPIVENYNSFYKEVTGLFNFKSMYEENHSYFQQGHFKDLDEIQTKITTNYNLLQLLSDRFSNILDAKQGCKLQFSDKHGGYHLVCTKNRSKLLSHRFQNNLPNHILIIRTSAKDILFEIPITNITFRNKDSNNVFIECDIVSQLNKDILALIQELTKLNKLYWKQSLDRLYSNYQTSLELFHRWLSDIDVSSCMAKVSLDHKYSCPILKESSQSYVIAKDIRHPLIEQISIDTEYVTNDICLGKEDQEGMLVFGTNACGKSTLMKAVGLSVIMAQAGFYVPCSSFEFSPYTQIFTRILNNDNIFRSQSSFAVEMMELKSIFQLSDKKSLILGDELCSGTETMSAISIVSQSLHYLSQKHSSFMITSHLHQLTTIPLVCELPNVGIYHLQITESDGVLIYDRKLVPGPGPPIYGLKVCEALGLPDDFIRGSNTILKQLMKQSTCVVSSKQSVYNKDVFMDHCGVCNGEAQETHHIKEQCCADSHNMIDHHHKNKKHNLVPLCKSCHQKVTYGSMIIRGWIETSEGRVLDYESIQSTKQTKDISEYIDPYVSLLISGKMDKKTCINMIDSEFGIRLTSKQITDHLQVR